MKKLDNNLKLIFIFIALFFLSGLYVFFSEVKNHDYQFNKQWTAVYLLNPQEESLDFAIENYEGEILNYQYLVQNKHGKEIINKEITINPKERKEIKVKEKLNQGKVIVKYKDQEKILTKL